ncbi:MAG: decaprenyl-phosphate phosphoribosyltransferase [Fulvivirga sp.]|nr:decaprenyl-phosphate phosphoribosyltransferase [Fulvivirga sp.]
MLSIIRLIRPQQWIKNLFLLIPMFFAGELLNTDYMLTTLLGIIAFSIIASSVYVINDIRDVEQDRENPKKRFRPIASGNVSVNKAIIIALILSVSGFAMGAWLTLDFFYILLIYFLLNIGYSAGLKQISILDILIIAAGFVLRTIAGGVVVDIAISQWLLIMIFLLSLFLAIAKRREDVLLFNSGVMVRKSIKHYNLQFIDSALTMTSGIIIIAYMMYTISPEAEKTMNFQYLYGTTVFVVAGMLRYLQITLVEKNSGSPVRTLYTDRFIQITLGLWILSFFLILYL